MDQDYLKLLNEELERKGHSPIPLDAMECLVTMVYEDMIEYAIHITQSHVPTSELN